MSLLSVPATLLAQEQEASIDAWVERTLASLTVEQKAGQLILARVTGEFHQATSEEFSSLESWMAEGRIGGVVVFAGPPRETRWLIDRLREVAPIPPLIASDYEYGVAMRVPGATRFPSAMALAANADGGFAAVEAMAAVTAREARALGVDLVLAPVLDLAVDPGSSVINRRSFGADPEKVAQLGARFIAGLQSAGVLAAAKHFPGHGATSVDTHEGLAIVDLSLDRLQQIELRPFQAAVNAGVAAIMPGHLVVPALDPTVGQPATRSEAILQGWLRQKLGFDGLIVSDALDMQGARHSGWDGGNTIAAVAAGVDVVLVPPDPRVALASLVRAVESGELPRQRLDASVRRVLRAKATLERSRAERGAQRPALEDVLAAREGVFAAELAAQGAITLVEDPEREGRPAVLPLSSRDPKNVVLVTVTRNRDRITDFATLEAELRRRAAGLREVSVTPETMATALSELATALSDTPDAVIVVAHAAHHERVSLQELEEFLSSLSRAPQVVLVSLGDPWSLLSLSGLRERTARLTSYDPSPISQSAIVAALYGESEITGRLPVVLSPEWPLGHGIRRAATVGRPLITAVPRSFKRVEEVMNAAIKAGATPGAALVVGRGGEIVLQQPFGKFSYHPDAKDVTLDTLWDLASLTKVVVTTTLTMRLVEEGRLELDAPVALYLPEFVSGGPEGEQEQRQGITVRDLLTHSSGILWWTDLYLRHGGLPPREAQKAYIGEIVSLPLAYSPRSKMVYSDLGILLLGEILQRVAGDSLDNQARRYIFEPLKMTATTFTPAKDLWAGVAPTENDPWRGRVLQGEVHDENAYGLGGVAPHAGLFSTAPDLARFLQMLLNGGVLDGTRLLNGRTIALFTKRAEVVADSSRAIGWDTPSGELSSAGNYLSGRSFGHTGFTGTSLWVDPERDLFVVLLTNRVHPTRENTQIRELRNQLHDAVILDLEGDSAVRRVE